MNKIVKSFAVIAFVVAVAIGATSSYFSDTETSTGNTFAAGAIDLKIDSKCTYNGAESDQCGKWELKDLVGDTKDPNGGTVLGDRFFNFSDVKPGDDGENTVSLHVFNNDAWACVNIIPTKNDDVSSTEPELEAGDVPNNDSIFDGELAQNMNFMIWADVCANQAVGAVPGDNKYQKNCDRLLTTGPGLITPTTYSLATPAGNVFTGNPGPLVGSQNYYLGVGWSIPDSVGNKIQTDNYQADISFYVEQSRNNTNFSCPSVAPKASTLRLENETEVQGGPWIVHSNDGIHADLTWSDGPTFNYNLVGQGLAASTNYSLIYYADGWPGNHPGAFIGSGTSDPSGNISFSGNPELHMSLPDPADGNYAVGAKIWLVLSSDYNQATKSMTSWNPAKYLFEGNVYIHYTDTNN